MKTMNESTKLAMVGTLVVLIAGAMSPLAAQQTEPVEAKPQAAAAKSIVTTEEEETKPSPKKSGEEGIKVHGHWIIDVKNSDGTIAEHRDFQNSLARGGPYALGYLLYGAGVASGFEIDVTGTVPTSFESTGRTLFRMYPAASSNSLSCGDQCYPSVITTLSTDHTTGATSIALSGQFIPQFAVLTQGDPPRYPPFQMQHVSTDVFLCVAPNLNNVTTTTFPANQTTTSPATCLNSSPGSGSQNGELIEFTGTYITPLDVAPGQTIAVQVTITFS